MTLLLVEKVAPTADAATTITASYAAPPDVDDLLVVSFVAAASAAVVDTAPAGWTEAVSVQVGSRSLSGIWYRVADGTTNDESATFTISGVASSNLDCELYRVTGAATSSPLDKTSSANDASTTSIQPGTTGTLTQADEFAVAVTGCGGIGNEAIDSGFTLDDAATHNRGVYGNKITTVDTALNPTMSWTTSRDASACIATFKEAPPPPPPPPPARPIVCEFSPGTGPFDTPVWVDLTERLDAANWTIGRSSEFDQFPPGTASLALKNEDRELDPEYTAGTWFGELQPRTPFRLRSVAPALHLDGTAGATASTPDHADFNVTDMDVRMHLAMDDWSSGLFGQFLVGQWPNVGGNNGWILALSTSGEPNLTITTDGTTSIDHIGDVLPFATDDGTDQWLRVTLDADNGSSGHDVKYWLSDDGVTWTQHGSTITTAGTVALFNSTADLAIGDVLPPTPGANVRYLEVRDGINGTIVANPEFTAQDPGTTQFVDRSGHTWTVNGVAVIELDDDHRTDEFYGFVAGGFVQDYQPPAKAQCLVELEDLLGVISSEPLPQTAIEVEILADSPDAYWTLDESEGRQMADSSGNGNHGTYDNGQHVDPLIIGSGKAFHVFHVGDHRGVFKGEALPVGPPCSIEAWIKTPEDHAQTKKIVVSQRDGTLVPRMDITVDGGPSSDNTGSVKVGFPSNYVFRGDTVVDDDVPHHIVLSIASTAGADINLYIDGELQTKTDILGSAPITTWPGQFIWTLGNFIDTGFGDFGLDGDLDEAAVYSTALSAARVEAHYLAGKTAFSDELSGERISRVLDIIGLPASLRDIATGDSTVGPAAYAGQGAGQYLASVAESEQGYLYINHRNGGKLTFRGRYSRITGDRSTAVLHTFSDQDDPGNLHYERDGLEVDPNSAAATVNIVDAEWRGGTVSVRDQAAVDSFGPQQRSIRTEAPSQSGAASAGDWLIQNYKDPQARVRGFRLAPDADKRVRPAARDLQISDRIATVRQPQSVGTSTTNELYVEGYSHSFAGGVHWTTGVVTSAADLGDWWIWGPATWGETTIWG